MGDPRDTDYLRHSDEVRSFNQALRAIAAETLSDAGFPEELRSIVGSLGGDPSRVLFAEACTGSDGREEKGIASPLDLVVYSAAGGIPEQARSRVSQAAAVLLPEPPDQPFRVFERVELKMLETPVAFYGGNPAELWPCRVLDARPLNEDDYDVTEAARRKLTWEICEGEGGSLGSRLARRIGERVAKYRKAAREGAQHAHGGEIVHFSMSTGEAYYDHELHRTALGPSAFKHNILRLVQTTLTRSIINRVRDLGLAAGEVLLRHLPQNTCEKLSFLESEGVFNRGKLPHGKLELLKDNYLYFLWLQHQAEYAFFHQRSTRIVFDAKTAAERRDDLVELARRAVY